MPQMMPLNWIMIFFLSLNLFMILIKMIYFLNLNYFLKPILYKKLNKWIWLWF